ncbi:MAG: FtsH protease activity modulator HflK [Rhodanobacteraceae bacterium]|nr:FtsH protease activity modulator HflK [Rhodanobacteraceae bacterium]MBK7042850.1 FtsH protease activity modulator HflK [Rhodanobacteraceae bacterium]MBP9154649.1 FtsH protease activity modulator HflK [Xanthomonadales bacterium]HQW80254.1 FtsH protease activity modulator HflK [Pseudomonadota bacterium]
MSTPAERLAELLPFGPRASRGGGGSARTPLGGGGAKLPRGMLGAIIAGVVLLWLFFSSYYTVQPEGRAVVKRLGAVIAITDPGLHFKLPFGIDTVEFVATERVLKQEFGFRTLVTDGERSEYAQEDFPQESLMLSGDLNIIDVEWVVQYRISDPIKYLYGMRDPTRALRDISESVMRRVVGNRIGSEVLTTARVDIANLAQKEIQEAMSNYDVGIHVVTLQLQDVVPPKAVQPAFNEVNEARQERERMINEATKRLNQEIPKASGEANRLIAEAEGYATERVNQSLGETARFRSILAEYRSAPAVTRARMYIDTIQSILPNIGNVMVVKDGKTAPLPYFEMRRPRSTPVTETPK